MAVYYAPSPRPSSLSGVPEFLEKLLTAYQTKKDTAAAQQALQAMMQGVTVPEVPATPATTTLMPSSGVQNLSTLISGQQPEQAMPTDGLGTPPGIGMPKLSFAGAPTSMPPAPISMQTPGTPYQPASTREPNKMELLKRLITSVPALQKGNMLTPATTIMGLMGKEEPTTDLQLYLKDPQKWEEMKRLEARLKPATEGGGFTLSGGQGRYDANGKLIVDVPATPPVPTHSATIKDYMDTHEGKMPNFQELKQYNKEMSEATRIPEETGMTESDYAKLFYEYRLKQTAGGTTINDPSTGRVLYSTGGSALPKLTTIEEFKQWYDTNVIPASPAAPTGIPKDWKKYLK